MKKFCIIIFLLLAQMVYGQRDFGNIQLRIEIGESETNGIQVYSTTNGIQVYSPNKQGCIIGALEVVNPSLAWHTDILISSSFLTRNDDIFKGGINNNQAEISENTLKTIIGKADSTTYWPSNNRSMVLFSFTPISEFNKADSVKFLFKYVYYQPIAKKSLFDVNYNVKYHIAFCTVAYDNLTNFYLLKDVLPDIGIKIKAHYIDFDERQKLNNKKEIEYIDLAYYKNTIKEIEESIKKSKIDARQIKFSFEYIRTDKKNEQLILNKLFFPLIGSNIAIMDNEYMKLNSFIYRGSLTSPMEFYEKDKNELLRQSPKWRFHKYTYDILIIPMEKKENELLCDVYFPSSTLIPLTYCYKKSISFKLGERIKIALPEGHWYINDLIDGKNTIITEESFRNYVNEYFVLFAESLGEIKTVQKTIVPPSNQESGNGTSYYIIKKGDKLSGIAKKFGIKVDDLRKWNKNIRAKAGNRIIIKKSVSK